MKRIKYLMITFIFFMVASINVYALDEYDVEISDAGVVTVKDSVDHSEVSDYSSILTYSDNTLTIKEGIYINYLLMDKETTLTSNDKTVYINYIHTSGYNDLTIKDLSRKTFTSSDTSSHNYDTQDGFSPKNEIRASNNLKIISSKIENENLTVADGMLHAEEDFTITDSIITLVGKYSYIESNDGTLQITNSTISLDYKIISDNGAMTIKDSNITLTGVISHEGYIYAEDNITIDNTTITALSEESYIEGLNISITNSTIDLDYGIESENDLTIKNSTIKLPGLENDESAIYSDGNTIIENSTITMGGDEAYIEVEDLTITDSEISLKSYISGEAFTVKNSKITFTGDDDTQTIAMYDDIIIEDSTITLSGYVGAMKDLTIKNSTLTAKPINTTYTPLVVVGNLSIDNSELTLESKTDMPALYVKGTVTFADSKNSFTTKDKTSLDLTKVVVSDSNFLKGTQNAYYMAAGDEGYTTTLNGELTTYAQTNVEKTITTPQDITNPKTGVNDMFKVFVISSILLVLLLLNINKFTTYKRL